MERMTLLSPAEATATQKILTAARMAGLQVELTNGGSQTPCGIDVPELRIGNLSVRYTNAILRRLAQSVDCGLMGNTFIEESQVDDWLELASLLVDHLGPEDSIDPICNTLEAHLKSRTYMVGQRPTLADISMSISCRPHLEKKGLESVRGTYPSFVRWLMTCVHALKLNDKAAPAKAAPAKAAPAPAAKGPAEPKAPKAPKAAPEAAPAPTAAPAQVQPAAAEGDKASKKDDKKKAKEDAKKAKEEEKRKREAEQKAAADLKARGPDVTLETMDQHAFGNLFIRSECKTGRTWTQLKQLSAAMKGEKVWIRARAQNTRKQGGKLCFLTLRQNIATAQAVCFGAELAAFAGGLPDESVVDIFGEVSCPDVPIQSCTQKDVELQVSKLFCVGRSQALPLQLADAAAPETAEDKDVIKAGQEIRLDNRIIDLRTAANQAIFRIQSGVCALFREFLSSQAFTEIHTPKLIGSASEGGADVFRVDYFGGNAYLAQSPQLYKQMVLMADMERVFEIGPIFRSEKSFTHRHMTEFMGLDMEMIFNDHYSEVLDVLDGMFNHIFKGLNERFKDEIEAVRRQYPFEDLKWKYPCRRFTFQEAIELLRAEGPKVLEERMKTANTYKKGLMQKHLEAILAHGIEEDISTEDERILGEVVSRKYGEDFYIIDKFPVEVRPFYSMQDPKDPRWANAYDFFLRGEEITSGAQRIHDPTMLQRNAEAKGITLHKPYLDSFKYGAYPHAGAGIGLERVVMLFLNLNNIRKTSIFPRDPKRIDP
eukprot:TRINITY_DN38520_c0_g1_i1.p2 TRINITY_DN38520_c0_g1~~TRINITY_DN38520_c0_g1_i1.p2  ORF type:complete len:768 (-),score=244.02 TRINITY_DN38520_c0_g1_i1:98-2401(-)